MNSKNNIYLSVVVTFYNEEAVIKDFHSELLKVLRSMHKTCEIVYIDDGSKDNTLSIMKGFVKDSPFKIKVIELRRNFGQTAGIQAGFDHSEGEIIIAMDGDLQHDPNEIPIFISKIEEGYDLVSGWRKQRVDNFFLRRFPSRIANKMMAKFSGIQLNDFGTTFKAYRKDLAKQIRLYGDSHRFIPVIASQIGAKIAEIPIKNIIRKVGKSKYGISRVTRVFFDIMTLTFFLLYSSRPMHFWGRLSFLFITIGSLLLSFIVFDHFVFHHDLRGTMQISIMFIILGIQLFAMGLILEFLTRIRHESTGQTIYSVRDIYSN